VLFTGDAINGRANQEHPGAAESPRGEPGLYVGAASYYLGHPDPARLQDSLRLALDALDVDEIDLICGAHSEPYRDRPAETLAALLALDWAPFLAAADWRERSSSTSTGLATEQWLSSHCCALCTSPSPWSRLPSNTMYGVGPSWCSR
jgi:hypothetical protein